MEKENGGAQLDGFDREILRIVQKDCQLKAETIADMVGLSSAAIDRRLKRMREEGIIKSEIAVVERKAIGKLMTFITGMEIEREKQDTLSKFRLWANQQDHIQQVYYVTGTSDIIAIITVENVSQSDDIAALIMAENPHIKRMHANLVLNELKVGLFIPIPESA